MVKNVYHICAVHLESFEEGHRVKTHERIVSSFDNLDNAVDYFLDLAKKKDSKLIKSEEQEIREEIYENPDSLFYDPYCFWLKEFIDYDQYYVGPGGYSLKGSVLQ